MVNGVLLIDRDGTLIEERKYLSDPSGVALLPGAAEGLRAFQAAGFRLVLVTNQSGVGRGYFTEARLAEIHDRMNDMLASEGIRLDAIQYCPHRPDENCLCRKPNTMMVDRALAELGEERPPYLVMIGDKGIDIEMGKRLNAVTILVRTGYGQEELDRGTVSPDFVADNLWDAAQKMGLARQIEGRNAGAAV